MAEPISKLRWQCRRGTRELDVLLLRYLETRYARLAESEKEEFRALLDLQDPELIGYLLQGVPPVPEIADVVHAILDQARS
jgi:antitoxin CptB